MGLVLQIQNTQEEVTGLNYTALLGFWGFIFVLILAIVIWKIRKKRR